MLVWSWHYQRVIVVNKHLRLQCTRPQASDGQASDCFHSKELGQHCFTDPQSAGFSLPCQAKAVQDKWSCGAHSSKTAE